jgi:16S rRNA (uracil1498-N3)-methyltransferase
MTRIYQPVTLDIDSTLKLDEKASHHLARVLRASLGDVVTLFNGQGGEYEAVISKIDKKGVEVEVRRFDAREVESPVNICLAQGIARGEKMDYIVQKAVELGVKTIVPLMTERCNVRLANEREEKRVQHWQSVAVSACEQSGRNRIPEICSPIALNTWLQEVKADLCFVLSPHVEHTLPDVEIAAGSTVVLLIGPEGGLSDQEVTLALRHEFRPLNLGPRVMRTETASIAAMSVLQYRYGDFLSKKVNPSTGA